MTETQVDQGIDDAVDDQRHTPPGVAYNVLPEEEVGTSGVGSRFVRACRVQARPTPRSAPRARPTTGTTALSRWTTISASGTATASPRVATECARSATDTVTARRRQKKGT